MKLYGLIGFPLTHSFSGKYFAEKFRKEGITGCSYNLYPLERIDLLPQLVEENPGLLGLNVTIPYKEKVLPYLDELDAGLSEVGAVNTIKIFHDKDHVRLKGFNTDMYGFSKVLLPLVQKDVKKAMVLGTGGAARAVLAVLKGWGLDIAWVSRRPKNNHQISYEGITPDLMGACKIIVNTSPVGMYPHADTCPDIPYKYLTPEHVLFDLVYNPEETLFMKMGIEKGAIVINGLKMLHLQADKAWDIWNSGRL